MISLLAVFLDMVPLAMRWTLEALIRIQEKLMPYSQVFRMLDELG